MTQSREQRLYEAVARWDERWDPADLIDAACQALIDGLDSPALRDLAGASPRDLSSDLHQLAVSSLAELDIPSPGTLPAGHVVAAGGGVTPRPGTDSLRLEVAGFNGNFAVEVFVNGVDMSAAGAGAGLDPYELLVPDNRFVATTQPKTVAIARCECDDYSCLDTKVNIVRDGDVVHWDWLSAAPMQRGVSFNAQEYDAEVARVVADYSWETPERTAGRLVLSGLDRAYLLAYGLTPSWAATSPRNAKVFRVAFNFEDAYQVFVDTPWRRRDPEALALEVTETLASPPREWPAKWVVCWPALTEPPSIAGRSWRQMRSAR